MQERCEQQCHPESVADACTYSKISSELAFATQISSTFARALLYICKHCTGAC